MRSAFAILALAGLSQAKVFLFNAEKCNTNFDNEANWFNVSSLRRQSSDFTFILELYHDHLLFLEKLTRNIFLRPLQRTASTHRSRRRRHTNVFLSTSRG